MIFLEREANLERLSPLRSRLAITAPDLHAAEGPSLMCRGENAFPLQYSIRAFPG